LLELEQVGSLCEVACDVGRPFPVPKPAQLPDGATFLLTQKPPDWRCALL